MFKRSAVYCTTSKRPNGFPRTTVSPLKNVSFWLVSLVGFTVLPLAILPMVATAQDGSIGVYADSNATQNHADFTLSVPTTLFIIATLDGQTAAGMVGAEFRVVGLPAAWFYTLAPNPDVGVTLGDPFRMSAGAWRANLAFATCQTGTNSRVLLYTVTVVPTTEVTDQVLAVEAGLPPSNPNFDVPLLNICDEPNFTKIAVQGRQFLINPEAAAVDYQVSPCDISVSDTSPSLGQQVDLQARIHNIGILAAQDPVAVRFLIDGTPVGADVIVGPIASLESAMATSALPWAVDFDLHQLEVVVNPDQVGEETSFVNNTANRSLPYDLRAETIPACATESPRMFSDCDPCVGSSIELQAVVRNLGVFDVDSVAVEFRETTSGMVSLGSVAVHNLAASGDCPPLAASNAFLQYDVTSPGDHVIEVVVDPGNAVPEYDESNNSYAQTLQVTCVPPVGFDYQIASCDISVSNPAAAVGEQVYFQSTVHNVGAFDAPESTTVRFTFDGQPFGADVVVVPIPAQSSVQVASSLSWSADFDLHQLVASVNPDTLLLEPQHDNNEASSGFPYDLQLQTDISCEWGAPGTCAPCVGDTVMIEVFVQNAGPFDVDSVEVSFVDLLPVPQGLGTLVAYNISGRSDCNAPTVASVTMPYEVTNLGLNQVEVTVDPNNDWPEFDEGNNSTQESLSVQCVSGPDLTIRSNEIYPSRFNMQPGSVLDSVRVVVRNVGRRIATDVRALLTLDGQPLCSDMSFGDIPAGGLKMVTCLTTWVAPEPPPFSFALIACADPDDLIPEMNEDNNCGSRSIGVGDPTPVDLTDLVSVSQAGGLYLSWKALDAYAQLAVDRRQSADDFWERLATLEGRRPRANEYADYSLLDTKALPGISYDYRVVGLGTSGESQVLGNISVLFAPPATGALMLYPNYPNPFNPSTQIRLGIPRRQHVTVRILDSSGRLVAQLWDGILESGFRTLTWHGKDAQGRETASGIYFCAVRTQEGRPTRKLVLLK